MAQAVNGPVQPTSSYESLSEDLWVSILQHVDWKTLAAVSQTCRYFDRVAAADTLWSQQWKDQYAQPRSSRMSSNDMGGCAIQHCTAQRQEASRALQLLGGVTVPPGSIPPLISDFSPGTGDGPPGSPTPAVGWKELFKRSREVDRDWETGRSTSEALEGHQDFIRCMQLSGDTLVSCSGSVNHVDCSLRIWDLNSNTCDKVLRGHMGPIWCMVYEPTLNRIASGSDDYTVRYWDSVSGNCVVMQDPDSAVRCIHMDAPGRQLVAGTEFGRLLLWDMDGLEEVLSTGVENVVQEFERLDQANGGSVGRMLQAGTVALGGAGGGAAGAAARRMVALLDGRQVVVDGSNHVRIMDTLEESKAISAIQVQGGLCASTSIEPPSPIQLWDVSQNSWNLTASVWEPAMQYANSLSFEKPLNRLVAGCGDRNMRVWDLHSGARLHLLTGHTDEIHAHQFDATTLASAALNGHIRVWDLRSGECRHVLQHNAAVHAFQFDGDRLVSGTWDGRVCLWDLRKGSLVREWYSHNERVWAVALDRYRVASGGLDRVINVRNFIPQCHQEVPGGGGGVSGVGVGDGGEGLLMPVSGGGAGAGTGSGAGAAAADGDDMLLSGDDFVVGDVSMALGSGALQRSEAPPAAVAAVPGGDGVGTGVPLGGVAAGSLEGWLEIQLMAGMGGRSGGAAGGSLSEVPDQDSSQEGSPDEDTSQGLDLLTSSAMDPESEDLLGNRGQLPQPPRSRTAPPYSLPSTPQRAHMSGFGIAADNSATATPTHRDVSTTNGRGQAWSAHEHGHHHHHHHNSSWPRAPSAHRNRNGDGDSTDTPSVSPPRAAVPHSRHAQALQQRLQHPGARLHPRAASQGQEEEIDSDGPDASVGLGAGAGAGAGQGANLSVSPVSSTGGLSQDMCVAMQLGGGGGAAGGGGAHE